MAEAACTEPQADDKPRPAKHSAWRRLKVAGGVLVFGYGTYTLVATDMPRMYQEWNHPTEYKPALGAKVVEARCKSLMLIVVNNCEVKGIDPSGETFTIRDSMFGPAPVDPVVLLRRAGPSPAYSTKTSLDTLDRRLLFLIASILFYILLWFSLALGFLHLARSKRKT